ncbi:MAG TPA: hypothetical protein PLX95_03200 [bacterium]|nr:hypothetical protein [bacterium]
MKNFKEFYNILKNSEGQNQILKVKGEEKKIRAMIRLTTKNYLPQNDEYIKMIFEDGSFLLVLKNDEELYYANNLIGKIEEISDEMIGKEEFLNYKGKKYKLGNKNDYQFVLKLIMGTPYDIEGECRFSDYFPIDGTKEFLSLGWLCYNGVRADINPKFIDHSEVEIAQK